MNNPTQPLPPATNQNPWQQSVLAANNLLLPTHEIAIVVANPDYDKLAAASVLAESFKKSGRKVYVTASAPIQISSQFASMPYLDRIEKFFGKAEITNQIPEKNVLINVSYEEGGFLTSRVDRKDDSLTINLIAGNGTPALTPIGVDLFDEKAKPQVMFAVGVDNLESFNSLAEKTKTMLASVPIINIDKSASNSLYGNVNLVNTKAVSVSELVTLFLYDLKFSLSVEMSQLLYEAIKITSNGFSTEFFTADFLEASSICLRYAERKNNQPKLFGGQ